MGGRLARRFPRDRGAQLERGATASQTVNVAAGDKLSVDLVSSATAAHLQVRSSDGKGIVFVDGVNKGEGSFAGDVAPGSHTVVIEREGYERFEKTVALGERETWAETVSLKPAGGEPRRAAPERAFEGLYGGFGFVGLFGVGGQAPTSIRTAMASARRPATPASPWAAAPSATSAGRSTPSASS